MKILFKRLIRVNLAILILILLAVVGFKFWEYKFYLSVIPEELGVYKIVYRLEDSWGFGPGGNESGVRVYELPEQVAQDIKLRGISYLKNLPSNTTSSPHRSRGHYASWLETPIEVTRHWTDYMSLNDNVDYSKETPSIYNYLNAYGFGVNINPEIADLINEAITKPGNYYAYGRSGVIIIIPDIKKVVFAYSG